MKFRFSFEKLLEMRRRTEDLARRDHALAAAAVAEANARLREMYAAVERARERAHALAREGGSGAAPLVQIDGFVEGQLVLIERHRLKIRELMAREEAAQAALVEAARERKTLEKLRERRFNEFKAEAKKREMKTLDELATTRHGRLDRQ